MAPNNSGPPSFTCPRGGRKSFNENDIAEGYCGACHDWTGDRRSEPTDGLLAALQASPRREVGTDEAVSYDSLYGEGFVAGWMAFRSRLLAIARLYNERSAESEKSRLPVLTQIFTSGREFLQAAVRDIDRGIYHEGEPTSAID